MIVHTAPQEDTEEDPNLGIIDSVTEKVQKMITKNKQDMNNIVKSRV